MLSANISVTCPSLDNWEPGQPGFFMPAKCKKPSAGLGFRVTLCKSIYAQANG